MAGAAGMMRDLDEATAAGIARLTEEAERRQVSVAALALAWVLAAPGITAPLTAPRDADQFRIVEEALGVDLAPEEWAEVGSHVGSG